MAGEGSTGARTHERLRKAAEIKAAQAARLREERIAAYRKLLAAATATIQGYNEATLAEFHRSLWEAYNEVELLAGRDKLKKAARSVWNTCNKSLRQ